MLNDQDPFFHGTSPIKNAPEKPREMTAQEHRAEAARLLSKASRTIGSHDPDIAKAQVHAILALSAPSSPPFGAL